MPWIGQEVGARREPRPGRDEERGISDEASSAIPLSHLRFPSLRRLPTKLRRLLPPLRSVPPSLRRVLPSLIRGSPLFVGFSPSLRSVPPSLRPVLPSLRRKPTKLRRSLPSLRSVQTKKGRTRPGQGKPGKTSGSLPPVEHRSPGEDEDEKRNNDRAGSFEGGR
jgi:hypothetical protein